MCPGARVEFAPPGRHTMGVLGPSEAGLAGVAALEAGLSGPLDARPMALPVPELTAEHLAGGEQECAGPREPVVVVYRAAVQQVLGPAHRRRHKELAQARCGSRELCDANSEQFFQKLLPYCIVRYHIATGVRKWFLSGWEGEVTLRPTSFHKEIVLIRVTSK